MRAARFLTITLIVHAPDLVTGGRKSTSERFQEVLDNARLAEELGFDGFGVEARHERPFISSSPPVVLSHVAAITCRIRLFTLSGYPNLEEAHWFGEGALPLLARRGYWRHPALA